MPLKEARTPSSSRPAEWNPTALIWQPEKHNYVLQANCEAIARKMENALCAPIIKLVPEGNLNPPTSHMRSPGTISIREETFRMMLEDTARSLRASTGFRNTFLSAIAVAINPAG